MDYIKLVEESFSEHRAENYPKFKAGDTITVTYKIKEGDKYRLQSFRGVVIQICGATPSVKTFTIRKVSNGIGVERIFPFESPAIEKIELNKVGKVRRARIFYLRDLAGKKARIKEAKRNLTTDVYFFLGWGAGVEFVLSALLGCGVFLTAGGPTPPRQPYSATGHLQPSAGASVDTMSMALLLIVLPCPRTTA